MTKSLVTCLILGCVGIQVTYGQICPPRIQWQQSLGGGGWDFLATIQQTSDGGYVMAGSLDSQQRFDDPIWDYWIVRLDAKGETLWAKSFDESGNDILAALEQTDDGGFLLAGASGYTDSRASDFWVVRLDSAGNKLWERTYGGSGSEGIYSMVKTKDGGFILAGGSNNGSSPSPPNFGHVDVWIVRVDANGNPLWDRYFGGSSDEWLRDIRQTADGGFIFAAYSDSPPSGNKTSPNLGGTDYWVVRLDANGNKQWDKSFGGSSYDYPTCAIESKNGGFIVGGLSWSEADGNKSSASQGLSDVWLLRLDENGNKVWEQSYGGSGADVSGQIVELADGGLLVAATSDSTDGDHSGPYFGEYDCWLLRLDAKGQKVWDQVFGGSNYDGADWGTSLRKTADNGFIFGATSASSMDGNKTSPSFGKADAWIIKLGPETICDGDGDGIADNLDLCPDTPAGAVVDANGCSIEQLAPCEARWKNHGHYVEAVEQAAKRFLKAGLITHKQQEAIVKRAEKSECGKTDHHHEHESLGRENQR